MGVEDRVLFEHALHPDLPDNPMIEKRVYFVQDSNSGVYNGNIVIDTSSLSQTGQYADYSSAFLMIPFCVYLKSDKSGGINASANAFMAGLKAGNHQIVHSLQCDLNNTNIISQQPLLNHWVSYKLMSSFSQGDVTKFGASIGFIPDSATSVTYNTTATVLQGQGTTNNQVAPISTVPFFQSASAPMTNNDGFFRRMLAQNYPLLTQSGQQGLSGNPELNATRCNQIAKSYVTDDGGIGAARVFTLNICAIIRLRDLADWFSKVPLQKGAFYRFTVTYNSASGSMNNPYSGNADSWVDVLYTQKTGQTCPIMLSSAATGNPLATPVQGAANTLTWSCGVVNSGVAGYSTPQLSACRLYVPHYSMSAEAEMEFLSKRPKSVVRYRDLYQYTLANVASGGNVTQILTNGVRNPKRLVIIPQISAGTANTGMAANTGSPYQSVVDSSPATCAYGSILTNLQVFVAGQSVFQSVEQYSFDQFLNESASDKAINGALTTGIQSGLISQQMYESAYGFITVDISRRVPSEIDLVKSVSIQATNNSAKQLDLICFIEYERSIVLDNVTGAIAV